MLASTTKHSYKLAGISPFTQKNPPTMFPSLLKRPDARIEWCQEVGKWKVESEQKIAEERQHHR